MSKKYASVLFYYKLLYITVILTIFYLYFRILNLYHFFIYCTFKYLNKESRSAILNKTSLSFKRLKKITFWQSFKPDHKYFCETSLRHYFA